LRAGFNVHFTVSKCRIQNVKIIFQGHDSLIFSVVFHFLLLLWFIACLVSTSPFNVRQFHVYNFVVMLKILYLHITGNILLFKLHLNLALGFFCHIIKEARLSRGGILHLNDLVELGNLVWISYFREQVFLVVQPLDSGNYLISWKKLI
ncbi:hypothetical protein ACJX0J_037908, partial [Zea mays]